MSARRPTPLAGHDVGTVAVDGTVPEIVEPQSATAQRARDGDLPARYAEPWRGPFIDRVRPVLRPGMTILDVGAGRRPTLPASWRPADTRYVGLDLSGGELAAAEPGAYDQIVVGDIGTRVDSLTGQIDLIVCWQVLEHVADLAASLENMRAYLRPGGRVVALLSGTYAAFAVLARLMPHPLRARVMGRALGVDPDSRFEVAYDRCHYTPLARLLADWSAGEVVPLYRGATYATPWRALERAYLVYENWVVRTDRRNLATHYLVVGDI